MIELFLAPENLLFSIALVLLFGIALLEGITTIIGFGFSQFLENLFPDMDLPEADIEVDSNVDVELPSTFTRLFGWIKIKGVPMIVTLILFLMTFSLSGFLFQAVLHYFLGLYLPWYLAVIPVLILTVPVVRNFSLILSRFVIKDETSVVSDETFIGKVATITVGDAREGTPAEAKLCDEFGQMHYIRVEPEEKGSVLKQHSEVLLIRKEKHVFRAIPKPSLGLEDY